MSQIQIVIEVQDGLVQDIFCSDPGAEVTVVDWDTEGLRPGDRGVVKVLDGQRASLVGVEQPVALPLEQLSGTLAEKAMIAARWQ